VLVDGDDDVPGAAEALGEDDEVAGAELDALAGALHGGPHPALHEVARQRRVELEREPPRWTAPSAISAGKKHSFFSLKKRGRIRVTQRKNMSHMVTWRPEEERRGWKKNEYFGQDLTPS